MLYDIPPHNFSGTEDSAYWEDFFTDEEIDKILSLEEWSNLENGLTFGATNPDDVDFTVRNSKVAWAFPNENTAEIYKKLSTVIGLVNAQFFRFDLTGMYEPLQLSVYDSKDEIRGHYAWHIDRSNSHTVTTRKLSMSLLLSDPSEFEGGELEIKFNSDSITTLEQKKGRAWFFPSWTLHRVAPVTKGVRKSLVLWISGPPFK
jgi:PKHD-type hydroxylase